MKNGIKTTEFWLSLISVAGLLLGAVWNYIPTEMVAKYITFIVAAYTVARAIAKLTPTTSDDKILDAFNDKILSLINKNTTEETKKN
jgi:hypothetical protein